MTSKLIQLPHAVPGLPLESQLCAALLLPAYHRDLDDVQMNFDVRLDAHACRVRSQELLTIPSGVENRLNGT